MNPWLFFLLTQTPVWILLVLSRSKATKSERDAAYRRGFEAGQEIGVRIGYRAALNQAKLAARQLKSDKTGMGFVTITSHVKLDRGIV